MNLKSLILSSLLVLLITLSAQELNGYHIGDSKDSVNLNPDHWQIIEDDKGLTAFQFNGEDPLFMQIALSFDKLGNLYNINVKTKAGKDLVRDAYKYIFEQFEGGKTEITGSCAEGSIKKFLWVDNYTKLDYKETCHGKKQATINWMKIR